jgi:hypothetical protein
MNNCKTIRIYSYLLLSLLSGFATGHGGGLDGQGGYNDRKSGEYHYHQEPCLSTHGDVERATQEAEQSGRAFSSLYDRSQWPHWIDADRNCRNTRHEILVRDSHIPVTFKTSRQCKVVAGQWGGTYTGKTLTKASQIDIDHVIPLKWAHGHGGDSWARDKKREFANDPENLAVSTKSANRQKGAKGVDDWMPGVGRCDYAQRWRHLIDKYDLMLLPSVSSALDRACR